MKKYGTHPQFLILLVTFFAGICFSASKRSADDYLHGGGGKYIQGRLQEASIDVEEGLREYPQDSRLKSLASQLKKMKDQKKKDQGSSGSQSGEDPNKKEDKKDSSSQGSKDKKDQEKKEQDKAKDQKKDEKKDEKKSEEKAEENKPEPGKEDKNKGDSSGQAPARAKPGQMSKEEAERLLNSYQDDEKREHQQMQRKQKRSVEVEQDW